MKKIFAFWVVVCCWFCGLSQKEWELKKNSEGIAVYTKNVENSGICTFKAVTICNIEPKRMLELLEDAENYPKWISQIESAKVISRNDNGFVVYYVVKMPIGFKKRDIVLENTIKTSSKERLLVELSTKNNVFGEKAGMVRITEGRGYWLVEKLGNGKCSVTYEFYSDPKGDFPAWLVNMFLVDKPFETSNNLKQIK